MGTLLIAEYRLTTVEHSYTESSNGKWFMYNRRDYSYDAHIENGDYSESWNYTRYRHLLHVLHERLPRFRGSSMPASSTYSYLASPPHGYPTYLLRILHILVLKTTWLTLACLSWGCGAVWGRDIGSTSTRQSRQSKELQRQDRGPREDLNTSSGRAVRPIASSRR